MSADQTGREMYSLTRRFYHDLDRIPASYNGRSTTLARVPLIPFYNYVRAIPYRQDVEPVEVVSRPLYIVQYSGLGMDCKKKAILLGSYLRIHDMPMRYIATSTRPDREIHHVLPQLLVDGNWMNLDATYPHMKPFQAMEVTDFEVLRPRH